MACLDSGGTALFSVRTSRSYSREMDSSSYRADMRRIALIFIVFSAFALVHSDNGSNLHASVNGLIKDLRALNGAAVNLQCIQSIIVKALGWNDAPPPPTYGSPSPPPQANPPPQGSCVVQVLASSPWQVPNGYASSLNLFITNIGATNIRSPDIAYGWTFNMTNPSYISSNQQWNFDLTSIKNGVISGIADQSWEILQAHSANTVNIGLIVTSQTSSFIPTSFSINGQACIIQSGPLPPSPPPTYPPPASPSPPLLKSPPAPPASCAVQVTASNLWTVPFGYTSSVGLVIQNKGPITIPSGWNFTMTNSAYVSSDQQWNFNLKSIKNGVLVGKADQSWEALLANGANSVSIGLFMTSQTSSFIPKSFSINGQACTVQSSGGGNVKRRQLASQNVSDILSQLNLLLPGLNFSSCLPTPPPAISPPPGPPRRPSLYPPPYPPPRPPAVYPPPYPPTYPPPHSHSNFKTYVPLAVILHGLTNSDCQSIATNTAKQAQFVQLFQADTARSFHNKNPHLLVLAVDIIILALKLSCSRPSSALRSLLQSSNSSSITINATISMPDNTTATDAASAASSFASSASSDYSSGSLAAVFSNSGASVSTSTPVVDSTSSDPYASLPSSTYSVTTDSSGPTTSNPTTSGVPGAVIGGIVGGVVFAAVIAAIVAAVVISRRKTRASHLLREQEDPSSPLPPPPPPPPPPLSSETGSYFEPERQSRLTSNKIVPLPMDPDEDRPLKTSPLGTLPPLRSRR